MFDEARRLDQQRHDEEQLQAARDQLRMRTWNRLCSTLAITADEGVMLRRQADQEPRALPAPDADDQGDHREPFRYAVYGLGDEAAGITIDVSEQPSIRVSWNSGSGDGGPMSEDFDDQKQALDHFRRRLAPFVVPPPDEPEAAGS